MGDWIEVNKKWGYLRVHQKDLIKAGMQIEVEIVSGHGVKSVERFLVGDVSVLGGECDHCKPFSNDDVLLRYRVLVDEKALEG